jgi:hypothetical protein
VDWEEAAIEREGVGEVKVNEFGNGELRGLGEKGRALWEFGRKNVETLVNGVTIVFILRNTTTTTAPKNFCLLIYFVLCQFFFVFYFMSYLLFFLLVLYNFLFYF